MRQPQLSIDERMATLFRIVDTDVESSGKHIDKCRQIDPCAVYAAYGSGEMQSRYQFHDIVRRETVVIWILRPIPERRWMDNKPGKDQSDFEIRQQKRRFEQRRLRRFLLDNPLLQPHQAGLEAGKFVQQVDKLFIRSMKGCTLRIRQSTVKQCVKHDDKLIFVQVFHNPVHKEFRWFALQKWEFPRCRIVHPDIRPDIKSRKKSLVFLI